LFLRGPTGTSLAAWLGALVATARASGDLEKRAWIHDVMVAPTHPGEGVGEAVMRLLLGHPALRRVRRVYLATRDAQLFYERLGFGDRRVLDARPYPSTEMVFCRA
jgi:ribosomal protein S18 acetylase RimI-like enzyme